MKPDPLRAGMAAAQVLRRMNDPIRLIHRLGTALRRAGWLCTIELVERVIQGRLAKAQGLARLANPPCLKAGGTMIDDTLTRRRSR